MVSHRHSKTSRALLVPAAILASVLGLAGCSAAVNEAGGGASGGQVEPAPAPGPAVDGAVGGLGSEAQLDGPVKTISDADRSVIVTGSARIVVDDPETSAQDVVAIVDEAGGRIDSRSISAPSDYSGGAATLTIRVPADALDGVIEQLRELGRVQNVSTNASDVTVEVQDLQARIGALRTTIERLEALQTEATEVDALIQLETAISDRQAQLESLEAQQRYYDDQLAMSTLTVDLVSESVAAAPEPGSFWDGIVTGWKALGGFFSGLLVALGVLVPWLIPLAIIAAIVWIAVAASRSRRRKRSLVEEPPEAAPKNQPPPPAPAA